MNTTTTITTPGGPWLQTRTGRAWLPLEPDSYDYDLEEIASALSKQCRFAGHVVVPFYSVGQHSALVAQEVEDRGWGLDAIRAALLHDAAEAFCVDLPQPIKQLAELSGYRALIKRVEYAIDVHFGLISEHPAVKEADLVLLATERRDVLAPSLHEWAPLPPPRDERIVPMLPGAAFTAFMKAWERVEAQRKAEVAT